MTRNRFKYLLEQLFNYAVVAVVCIVVFFAIWQGLDWYMDAVKNGWNPLYYNVRVGGIKP